MFRQHGLRPLLVREYGAISAAHTASGARCSGPAPAATRPASTSVIASLTASSGRVSRWTVVIPAVQLEHLAQVGAGADDRAHDRDPVQDGLEIGIATALSAGSPTKTSVPCRRKRGVPPDRRNAARRRPRSPWLRELLDDCRLKRRGWHPLAGFLACDRCTHGRPPSGHVSPEPTRRRSVIITITLRASSTREDRGSLPRVLHRRRSTFRRT